MLEQILKYQKNMLEESDLEREEFEKGNNSDSESSSSSSSSSNSKSGSKKSASNTSTKSSSNKTKNMTKNFDLDDDHALQPYHPKDKKKNSIAK